VKAFVTLMIVLTCERFAANSANERSLICVCPKM
jgi:hypothetical protein